MVPRTSQWLKLVPLSLLLICLVGCQPTHIRAQLATFELDRSIRLRFDCPPSHGDTFAIDYLPAVWRSFNSSASHLTRQHGMRMCQSELEAQPESTIACLAVSGGLIQGSGGVNKASVYLIQMDLHSVKGRPPSQANRMAFHHEAALLMASIKALEGLEDCARLNATVWARADCDVDGNGSCPSPAHSTQAGGEIAAIVSAMVFIALICCIVLAAVLLVKRRQMKELERQQQQQQQYIQLQQYPTTRTTEEPQLRSHADRQQRHSRSDEPQPRRRNAAGLSAASRNSNDANSSAASWIVGPPLPAKPRISSIGWLNLAYNADDDEDDSCSTKGDENGDSALPSRLTRFRAVGDVDEAEARRQFARLGDPVGGDPGAFYRVGDMTLSEAGLAFVLANSCPNVVTDERILELIWACDGVVVSLDPGFVDRLCRPYVPKMRSASELTSPSTSPLELTSVNTSPANLSTSRSIQSEHTASTSMPSEHTASTSMPSEHTASTSTPSEHTTSTSTPSEHTASTSTPSEHTTSPPTPSEHTASTSTPSEHTASTSTPSEHTASTSTPSEHTASTSTPSEHTASTSTPSEHTASTSPPSEHTASTSTPSEHTASTSPPSEHTASPPTPSENTSFKSTPSSSSSRFHLVGWERSSFPCHTLVTATIHCLDTNLSKRLRVCQFAGRLNSSPDGGDIPASISEFVRFSRACADQHLTATSSAPSAAVGRGHSAASLLPLLLLAARRTRLSDSAERGGGSASCDLLRLAAGLRRQCPLALGSEAQYLFLMRCLHAYACLMKRNSV